VAQHDADLLEQHGNLPEEVPERLVHLRRPGEPRRRRLLLVLRRDDDVINTGGHLVGPFEIESALLEHPAVAESAAIGKPDPINMEVVKAFVALKPGFEPPPTSSSRS